MVGTIHLTWHDWGDDCNPSQGCRVSLYHGGSHGESHRHWILAEDVMGSEGDFTLPADVPTDGLAFIRAYKGPRCEGTTSALPINP